MIGAVVAHHLTALRAVAILACTFAGVGAWTLSLVMIADRTRRP